MQRSFAIVVDEITLTRLSGVSGVVGVFSVENGIASCSIFKSDTSLDEVLAEKAVSPYRTGYELALIDLETELEAVAKIVDLALEHSSSEKAELSLELPRGFTRIPVRSRGGFSIRWCLDGMDMRIRKELAEQIGVTEGSTVSLSASNDGMLAISQHHDGVGLIASFLDENNLTISRVFEDLPLEIEYFNSEWVEPDFALEGGAIVFSARRSIEKASQVSNEKYTCTPLASKGSIISPSRIVIIMFMVFLISLFIT